MAASNIMAEMVESLRGFGFFDFYLPFFIMFTVFWAVLTKIKLFGDPKKEKLARNVNLVVSLGASMYILASTELGFEFSGFLSTLFGSTFIILLTIISFTAVLFVLYSVVTGNDSMSQSDDKWKLIATLTVIAAIVYALLASADYIGIDYISGLTWPGINLNNDQPLWIPTVGLGGEDTLILLMIGVTILAVAFITKGEDKS